MGIGAAFTQQDKLITDFMVQDQNIGQIENYNYDIVGDLKQGINALIYKDNNDNPVFLLVRSIEYVNSDKENPILVSSKKVHSLNGTRLNESNFIIVYSAKQDNEQFFSIYLSIFDYQGNVVHQDILVDNYNSDNILPRIIYPNYNDIVVIAWQSENRDTSDSKGIFAINIKVSYDKNTNCKKIGEIFQVNEQADGDQIEPYMTLVHQDSSITDPQLILIAWSGQGYYYNQDTDTYLTDQYFEDNNQNLVQNNKPFFRVLQFEDEGYNKLDQYYTDISTFTSKNYFYNVKIITGDDMKFTLYWQIIDDPHSYMYVGLLKRESQNKIKFEVLPNGCYITLGQNSEILNFNDNTYMMVKKYISYLRSYGIAVLNNYDNQLCTIAPGGQGWQFYNEYESLTSTKLTLNQQNSGKTISILQYVNTGKLYYQELYQSEQRQCSSIENCDLCYIDEQNNEQCLFCKGSTPYWREIRKVDKQQCTCQDRYYNDDSKLDCLPVCATYCNGCTLSPTDCTSCKTQNGRSNTAPCNCLDTYYDKDEICEKCQKPCVNCQSENTCLSCIVSSNRMTQPPCKCLDTFYDDENFNCQPCQLLCKNCLSDTICLSCQDPLMEINDQNECVCIENYFWDDLSSQCIQCNFPCFNCTSQDVCIDCNLDNYQVNSNGRCNCQEGYYFSIESQNCEKCQSKCKSCNNFDECQACKVTYPFRIKEDNCNCPESYKDNENGDCVIDGNNEQGNQSSEMGGQNNFLCAYNCLTCGSDPTMCLSCTENRDIQENCSCKDDFVEYDQKCISSEEYIQIQNQIIKQQQYQNEENEDTQKNVGISVFLIIMIAILSFLFLLLLLLLLRYLKKQKDQKLQSLKVYPIGKQEQIDIIQQQEQSMDQKNQSIQQSNVDLMFKSKLTEISNFQSTNKLNVQQTNEKTAVNSMNEISGISQLNLCDSIQQIQNFEEIQQIYGTQNEENNDNNIKVQNENKEIQQQISNNDDKIEQDKDQGLKIIQEENQQIKQSQKKSKKLRRPKKK